MSQLSAPLKFIVETILPNYSDGELQGMLLQRQHNKKSLLYQAVRLEMAKRSLLEYEDKYGVCHDTL